MGAFISYEKIKCFNTAYNRHHDTQHNDIQHNDTQHKGIICDTQHKWHSVWQHCHYVKCYYAQCHNLFIIMVFVVILIVVMLGVVAPSGQCVGDSNVRFYKTFYVWYWRQSSRKLGVIILNVITLCRYAEWYSAQSCCTEWHYLG